MFGKAVLSDEISRKKGVDKKGKVGYNAQVVSAKRTDMILENDTEKRERAGQSFPGLI